MCKKVLAGPLTPTRGKVETTDHPPIHPTGQGDPTTLDGGQLKLYNLIARRFLATLMGPATIENTKLSIDVAGEPFAASGDVLVKAGFREAYPYGLKRDEQLPVLAEGDVIDVRDIKLEAKQTEPPARYSQGKLVQEMEKRGLGTKSTRASIIERLYTVRYLKNDPIEPSQLGIAIIDALSEFAPRVTTPDMTAELDADMTKVAEGKDTQDHVVDHSRALLAGMLDALIEHKDDLGEAISDAVTADARVGACPKCGKDLVMKTSAKTRGSFIGCMGWPDCDVTYPVPSGVKVSPLEGEAAVCPECGAPRIKCQPFRQKAYEQCVNPKCPTNFEPDLKVGECSVCAEAGRHGDLIAHKSEKSGKRFIRCANYEECGVSYPLPARGKLSATGEVCEHCGAPVVVVETARGPWRICVNMDCPGKEKKPARGKAGAKKPAAKPGTKKPAAKRELLSRNPSRRRQRRRRNLQNASKPQIALYPGRHKPPGTFVPGHPNRHAHGAHKAVHMRRWTPPRRVQARSHRDAILVRDGGALSAHLVDDEFRRNLIEVQVPARSARTDKMAK